MRNLIHENVKSSHVHHWLSCSGLVLPRCALQYMGNFSSFCKLHMISEYITTLQLILSWPQLFSYFIQPLHHQAIPFQTSWPCSSTHLTACPYSAIFIFRGILLSQAHAWLHAPADSSDAPWRRANPRLQGGVTYEAGGGRGIFPSGRPGLAGKACGLKPASSPGPLSFLDIPRSSGEFTASPKLDGRQMEDMHWGKEHMIPISFTRKLSCAYCITLFKWRLDTPRVISTIHALKCSVWYPALFPPTVQHLWSLSRTVITISNTRLLHATWVIGLPSGFDTRRGLCSGLPFML